MSRGKSKRLLSLTLPVLIGYVSVGAVYGIVARGAGLSLGFAVASSVFLYAGAAQFLLVRLIQSGAPLAEVFLAVLFLNVRHVFYYRPVRAKLSKGRFAKLYSTLALTDETFAVLAESRVSAADTTWVIALNHAYWIVGTALGALFGGWLAGRLEGLDFALVALFVVLLVEKAKWPRDTGLVLACTAICGVIWLALPARFFVLTAMVGCLLAATYFGKRQAEGVR